jgi:hypothetical protein
MHCLLSIQKHHQRQEKNKGNTVLIFDREVKEESRAAEMVIHPPGWTDAYYGRGPKQGGLDQIVDVPYFADSQHALLLQVADLVAYVLRKHGELVEGLGQEAYVGEQRTVGEWAEAIFAQCIPQAMRYPKKARCQVAEAFWAIAPESLRR